ncbi:uncharacterized protein cubi_02931 [Cryptosporidium ubiquitum]|uniref:MI domain-containing protein n=1 Tax=Cryptosporidium ubiquitum TaxID=857276 RepID=A0A1J4MIR4_9CRYT|nr:uncharacterized protein cubi_02931 [Cryptosporidium ubiquitum]OII74129.1 hypothetical protein cubi_02931 [Cryptosporidium ubiquitum]
MEDEINDIVFLEKKLGIIKRKKDFELHEEKKRKALYKKIEKEEGVGDDFMTLIDGILSDIYTKKKKKKKIENESKHVKKSLNNNISIQSQKFDSSSQSNYQSILNWKNEFGQRVQGLFNRLSEGNMTLILGKLIELIKSTVRLAYNNHNFGNDSIFQLRNESIQIALGYFNNDYYVVHRLIAITDIIESELIMLFVKNCISQPHNTASLNTVYSALISSVGIILEGCFNRKLMIVLNKIYNETLSNILQNLGSNIEKYNNKIILRHITISLIAIYRCGFVSSSVIENFIKAGIDRYKCSKSNIIYWECFFDNVLTIIRGSAFYIREESNFVYENMIESVGSVISKAYNFESQLENKIEQNHSEFVGNPLRLRFVIEELNEWKNSLKNQTLSQKLRRREGIIERQLNTVHNWSLNCVLLKHLQVIHKSKKKNQNSVILELVTYPKTLIDYIWQETNKNLFLGYINKIPPEEDAINKLIIFYNLGIKKLSPKCVVNKEYETVNSNITNNQLLGLASKMRFTSDIQKSIFIALIGASDEFDAINRLTSLKLTQSRTYLSSVINVIVISSFSEHIYNPFYYKVLKGLTELPAVISKKINGEIVNCFSQKLGILHTFNIRKIMVFAQLVKDCIFDNIFDLRIIRFIKINDIHALAGSIGLFLKELMIQILLEKKNIEKSRFIFELFSVVSKMPDLREVILFVLQVLVIPAIEKNLLESNNNYGISKILMSHENSSLYPKQFSIFTNDGVKLSCRSFGNIPSKVPVIGIKNIVFVLVHPYGIMGGSSSNMLGLALSLADKGYGSIIFDHRGIGKSTGYKSIFGNSEVFDVISICNDIKGKNNSIRVILIGSSAGAPIAGSAVDECENVVGYIGIGYVFGFWPSLLFKQHFNNILRSKKHKLFIMGDSDGFTSIDVLKNKMHE